MSLVTTPKIFYIEDIIRLIKKYLEEDTPLFDCNKSLNGSGLKCFKLNHEYSLKYLEDIDFKNLVNSRIKNSKSQLSLDLSYCYEITDEGIKYLSHVHTLILNGCRKITDEGIKYLCNLHTLHLGYVDQITDEGIKHLSNLHTLDLTSCREITDEGIRKLVNVKNIIR